MIKAPPNHAYTAENLMRTYPSSLAVYDNMLTLGDTAFRKFEEYYNEIREVLIYPAIDNMPEEVLDILAQDLKVDWYDYNYSLESKRELIKTSVYVHKFLGTKAAVERMLGSVFPGSIIEEWFDYGGDPHHFRVVIAMEAAKETANIERIIRAVNMAKRLSSWLDGVVYRTSVGIFIQTHVDRWRYASFMDQEENVDGTHPWRSDIWQPTDTEIRIQTKTTPWRHPDELEGTVPWRSDIWQPADTELQIQTQADPWIHSFGADAEEELTGTRPWRSDMLSLSATDVPVQTTADPMPYPSEADGKPIWASAQGDELLGRLDISADVTVYSYRIRFDREDEMDRDI